jgi:PKD repeat protein
MPINQRHKENDVISSFKLSEAPACTDTNLSVTHTTSTGGPILPRHPVSFAATCANITDITYTWDFGDGSSANGASVSHRFDRPGSYEVAVTATKGAARVTRKTSVFVSPAVYLPIIFKLYTYP